VVPSSGKSYYIPFDEARAMVARKDAAWQGNKRVIRVDKSKRGIWEIATSGRYGPGVMQLT